MWSLALASHDSALQAGSPNPPGIHALLFLRLDIKLREVSKQLKILKVRKLGVCFLSFLTRHCLVLEFSLGETNRKVSIWLNVIQNGRCLEGFPPHLWQAAVATNVLAPPALSLEQVVEMQDSAFFWVVSRAFFNGSLLFSMGFQGFIRVLLWFSGLIWAKGPKGVAPVEEAEIAAYSKPEFQNLGVRFWNFFKKRNISKKTGEKHMEATWDYFFRSPSPFIGSCMFAFCKAKLLRNQLWKILTAAPPEEHAHLRQQMCALLPSRARSSPITQGCPDVGDGG